MTDYAGLSPAIDPRPVGAWCGPSALAAITGKSVVEVEDAILAYRKRNPPPRRNRGHRGRVVSMWWSEVEPVCKALGWRVIENLRHGNPTFAAWRRTRSGIGPYLVLITGHFVAVSGHWFVDSNNREPIPATKYRHQRTRVKRVARLEPMEHR